MLLQRGLEETGATADPDALAHLVARAGGDGRATLGALEVAVALAGQRGEPPEVRLADAEAAVDAAAMGYGVDDHYDVASAFIKSIRGSDPDAGLYWLARMLEAGRTPARAAPGVWPETWDADPQGCWWPSRSRAVGTWFCGRR